MTRTEYFEQLLERFEKHIEAKDYRTETEIKDGILNWIENNPLPDPDEDENGGYEGDGNFAPNH